MTSIFTHQPGVAQERLVNILHSLGKSRIPELEVGDFYDDLERTGAERESDKLETWEEQLGVRLGLRIIDQVSGVILMQDLIQWAPTLLLSNRFSNIGPHAW